MTDRSQLPGLVWLVVTLGLIMLFLGVWMALTPRPRLGGMTLRQFLLGNPVQRTWWRVQNWFHRCPECHQRGYSTLGPRWADDPVAQMLGLVDQSHCGTCGKPIPCPVSGQLICDWRVSGRPETSSTPTCARPGRTPRRPTTVSRTYSRRAMTEPEQTEHDSIADLKAAVAQAYAEMAALPPFVVDIRVRDKDWLVSALPENTMTHGDQNLLLSIPVYVSDEVAEHTIELTMSDGTTKVLR